MSKKKPVEKAHKPGLEYEVAIPHCYTWLARTKQEYIGYVMGYVRASHPGFRVVRIEKGKAICIKEEQQS
ncbi:hypothetical protein P9726_00520 [Geobacillus stearothermophilus]|uniref:Uncharacterized protein n=1 Tax=Geobacillus thermoleovorans TaxID=33941 RepID=A0A2Z3N8W5_GEOTH|nr:MULTISPECIES: hypothetical protein [Geobacillus]AWO74941.1 hypothetical protein C1N76_10850 [Geobacillus thermoleovorans]MBW7642584.1 hypothetical protein [Geobacillus thermoleovorans]MED4978237.1 hypothetical protein [Geobacillus stearothermophilus]